MMAGHQIGEMLLRAFAIFAVFGFMPTAAANFATPPRATITSEKEFTMATLVTPRTQ